jgi:hypothetical protein
VEQVPLAAIGLIGALVGYAAKFFTDLWTSDRQEAKHLARERETFQRDTLLELQEMLFESVQLSSSIYARLTHHFINTGKWGDWDWDPEITRADLKARARVRILGSRVTDDHARTMIYKFLNLESESLTHSDHAEAENARSELRLHFDETVEAIGDLLRRQTHQPRDGGS